MTSPSNQSPASALLPNRRDEADECLSCGEEMPLGECSLSKRPCGHHCNCSWIHDCCHWCGAEFGEEVTDAVG